ncbi:MAG: hypothetical protein IPJ85_17595 [Flavobacteriales bacterium]|nr:hypothetical protein [Flavobacteriales bacterium]
MSRDGEGGPPYLVAAKKHQREAAIRANYRVLGRHRKPFMTDPMLRRSVIGFFVLLLALAVARFAQMMTPACNRSRERCYPLGTRVFRAAGSSLRAMPRTHPPPITAVALFLQQLAVAQRGVTTLGLRVKPVVPFTDFDKDVEVKTENYATRCLWKAVSPSA